MRKLQMNKIVAHSFILILISSSVGVAAEGPQLALGFSEDEDPCLRWTSSTNVIDDGLTFPSYKIQKSSDLKNWNTEFIARDAIGGSDGILQQQLGVQNDATAFYRIIRQPRRAIALDGGAEMFGYQSAFDEQLEQIGEIPISVFAEQYCVDNYLAALSFDPTASHYYTNLMTAPYTSYELNSNELASFSTNGFVVTSRRSNNSFDSLYYDIYYNDLPVFISTDSILHAWHRTYIGMLEEIEEANLAPTLKTILDTMHNQLEQSAGFANHPVLGDGFKNADVFLGVARSLLDNQLNDVYSKLNQGRLVTSYASAAVAADVQAVSIFGSGRDMTQFKVRGHYEASETLQGYFRAMMWCGYIDFRVSSINAADKAASLRDLATAITLYFMMEGAGQQEGWKYLETVISTFIGPADSMSPLQLGDLLQAAGIYSLADISTVGDLENLQHQILQGSLGTQNITSHPYLSPLSGEQIILPRSYTFLGQRFVLDSWVMSKTTFDDILWHGEPPFPADETFKPSLPIHPRIVEGKVIRRIPSGLDVAFAALGNNHVSSIIAERIDGAYEEIPELPGTVRFTGRAFRDGIPYQHNLSAVRSVIDSMNPEAWQENIYSGWLYALRALSEPTTTAQYPDAMRTRAWALKTTETQLASWTQLRHDTVLYAKQSVTEPFACEYPYGYVEPIPEFYDRMEALALMTANKLESLSMSGLVRITRDSEDWGAEMYHDISRSQLQLAEIEHLRNFADKMIVLSEIARKELSQEALTVTEEQFLQDTIEIAYQGYDGWYPGLIYENFNGAFFVTDFDDRVVTDVHTDFPDTIVGDPGMILHQGVGDPHLLVISINSGPDQMVYCGPVFSHYEFEMPSGERMTDNEWQSSPPPTPAKWTAGFHIQN